MPSRAARAIYRPCSAYERTVAVSWSSMPILLGCCRVLVTDERMACWLQRITTATTIRRLRAICRRLRFPADAGFFSSPRSRQLMVAKLCGRGAQKGSTNRKAGSWGTLREMVYTRLGKYVNVWIAASVCTRCLVLCNVRLPEGVSVVKEQSLVK
jgi:hypothetical protein